MYAKKSYKTHEIYCKTYLVIQVIQSSLMFYMFVLLYGLEILTHGRE